MSTGSNQASKVLPLIGSSIGKISFVLIMTTCATLMAMSFKRLGFHESNIIITYLLGVLLVSYWIEGYLYGVLASFLGVLTFNFFFTEPYYSLLAYRQDYPVTFAIMLFAAVLTSTLTSKVKQEAKLSKIREKRAFVLYKMSQGLLRAQTADEICSVVGVEVSTVLDVAVIIALKDESQKLGREYAYYKGIYKNADWDRDSGQLPFYISDEQRAVASKVFRSGNSQRYEKRSFDDLDFYYAPINGQAGTLGVLGISLKPREIMYEEKEVLIQAMTSQIGLAFERVLAAEVQKSQHIEIESERLRGNLLRAISHDLRTPLTGILGAVTTIINHGEQLQSEQKQSLLADIAEDTQWLIQSVENILSMTRFDEGKVKLHLKMELIDDLVLEALNRFKANESGHEIEVNLPETLIALEIDGQLMQQVLVNLVDNAIKYTPKEAKIEISVTEGTDLIEFTVADHGKGIAEEHLPLLFNRFFTAGIGSDRGKTGIGLGLEICKSIVEAHGGSIRAFNNAYGGASFAFTIPRRRVIG